MAPLYSIFALLVAHCLAANSSAQDMANLLFVCIMSVQEMILGSLLNDSFLIVFGNIVVLARWMMAICAAFLLVGVTSVVLACLIENRDEAAKEEVREMEMAAGMEKMKFQHLEVMLHQQFTNHESEVRDLQGSLEFLDDYVVNLEEIKLKKLSMELDEERLKNKQLKAKSEKQEVEYEEEVIRMADEIDQQYNYIKKLEGVVEEMKRELKRVKALNKRMRFAEDPRSHVCVFDNQLPPSDIKRFEQPNAVISIINSSSEQCHAGDSERMDDSSKHAHDDSHRDQGHFDHEVVGQGVDDSLLCGVWDNTEIHDLKGGIPYGMVESLI
ncbi:hypothetical protein RUND412_007892 [Rhizina undulata]